MANPGGAAAAIDAADRELDAMARDAERWRYYAGRVAAMMGITIDQMAREVDESIETARSDATSSGSSLNVEGKHHE